MNERVWKVQPPLALGRYKHSCGALRHGNVRVVLAVAGITHQQINNAVGDTVETLMVTEVGEGDYQVATGWQFTGKLPIPLSETACATPSDQASFYVIGGTTLSDEASSFVFRFSCSDIANRQCHWTKVEFELQMPSTKGLALVVPQAPMVLISYSNARDCTQGMYYGNTPSDRGNK